MGVLLQICYIFSAHLILGTPLVGCFWIDVSLQFVASPVEDENGSSKSAPWESMLFSIAVIAGLPPQSCSHRSENVNNTLPPPLFSPLSIALRKSGRIFFNLADIRSLVKTSPIFQHLDIFLCQLHLLDNFPPKFLDYFRICFLCFPCWILYILL